MDVRITPSSCPSCVVDARRPPSLAAIGARLNPQPGGGAVARCVDHAPVGAQRQPRQLGAERTRRLRRERRSEVRRCVISLRARDQKAELRIQDLRQLTDPLETALTNASLSAVRRPGIKQRTVGAGRRFDVESHDMDDAVPSDMDIGLIVLRGGIPRKTRVIRVLRGIQPP